jgi:fermentation-respiration switch protein FrsA (DUF1100 family)
MIKKLIRLSLLAASLLACAAVAAVLWLTHARASAIVHPAHSPVTWSPEANGYADFESVSFKSSGGLTLQGWYVPTRNGAVVVLVHGHAGNRQHYLPQAGSLVARGYGVLLFDLRNSGDSQGDTTTMGLLEVDDVRGAIELVKSKPGVDHSRIGLMGQSLGGATVIMAAARIPEVGAVVAESAYTSLEDNIRNGVERLAFLPAFPFAPLVVFWGQQEAGIDIAQVRPVDDIASISPRPILIVHGERDDIIPVENAHKLYEAAREPKELYLLPEAGHYNFAGVQGYMQKITEFFDRSLLGK